MDEINELITPVQMRFATESDFTTLEIIFITQERFVIWNLSPDFEGWYAGKASQDDVAAMILINSELRGTTRKGVILHEMTHALGLYGHSDKYSDGVLSYKWDTITEFSDRDRECIRFLYHPSITVGMTEDEVRSLIHLLP